MFGSNPLGAPWSRNDILSRIEPTFLTINTNYIAVEGHTTFLVHFTMLWPMMHDIILLHLIVIGPFYHKQFGFGYANVTNYSFGNMLYGIIIFSSNSSWYLLPLSIYRM